MEWYGKHYKKLFLLPAVLLVASIIIIALTTINTGSFVHKGVSLKGGVSATLTIEDQISIEQIERALKSEFPQADIVVRSFTASSGQTGALIDASDINTDARAAASALRAHLESAYTISSLSVETTGPSLGDAFFFQTLTGILLAFLWMGWVVFLYFGEGVKTKVIIAVIKALLTILTLNGVLTGVFGGIVLALCVLAFLIFYLIKSVPSGAVILAATSTILFTLAVIDVLGLRLSAAGIAAFLMLIGYSVDTDILLSTRVLRSNEGSVFSRIKSAFKTGITMQLTTTVAVLVALLLSTSDVIKQIMFILFIGMIGDIIFTWLQNAGVLYWHVHKDPKHAEKKKEVVQQSSTKKHRSRGKRRWKKR